MSVLPESGQLPSENSGWKRINNFSADIKVTAFGEMGWLRRFLSHYNGEKIGGCHQVLLSLMLEIRSCYVAQAVLHITVVDKVSLNLSVILPLSLEHWYTERYHHRWMILFPIDVVVCFWFCLLKIGLLSFWMASDLLYS